ASPLPKAPSAFWIAITATVSVSSRSRLTHGAPPPNWTRMICAHSRVRVVSRLQITRPRVEGTARIEANRHSDAAADQKQPVQDTRATQEWIHRQRERTTGEDHQGQHRHRGGNPSPLPG